MRKYKSDSITFSQLLQLLWYVYIYSTVYIVIETKYDVLNIFSLIIMLQVYFNPLNMAGEKFTSSI
jgi:hypothetical protein